MARYTGPRCRLSRREGTDLFLKSGIRRLEEKCRSDKDGLRPPGMMPTQRRNRSSDYGLQLREKQKARRMYGILERQFRNYYREAARMSGATGLNLLRLLESRLDNVVYRIGLGSTRSDARQLVAHRAIEVNGQVVNIPSCQIACGDKITVRPKARGMERIARSIEVSEQRPDKAAWLDITSDSMEAVFRSLPERRELSSEINEDLIVELYSK